MPDELNKKLREKYENIITTNGNKLTRKNAIITNDENKINAHKKNINKIMEINLLRSDIKDKLAKKQAEISSFIKKKVKIFQLEVISNSSEIVRRKTKMHNMMQPNRCYERLGVDSLLIHVSYDLIKLIDPEQGGLFLFDFAQLRTSLTDSIGYIIPNIRAIDYTELEKYQYSILIRGQEVFKGYVSEENIKNNNSEEIIKNLKDVCIKYVHQIMTRSDALKIMELVKSEEPTLVNDLIPTFLSSTDIKKILANLIHDGFSIKDILFIFEQLNDHARYTQDTDELTEIIKNELMFYLN